MTPATYLRLRRELREVHGFEDDYAWSQAVEAPADAESFAWEYIWVVVNSGMKHTVAELIMGRIRSAIEAGKPVREAFRHPGKAAAIQAMWDGRDARFAEFLKVREGTDEEVLAWCRGLAWIGKITCYHLFKNLGGDVAKPDLWLVRVAAASSETVDGLCGRLAAATGDRKATVDLMIWRACAIGIYDPRRDSP